MYITGQGDYTAELQVQQSAREDCEETTGQCIEVFGMFDLSRIIVSGAPVPLYKVTVPRQWYQAGAAAVKG